MVDGRPWGRRFSGKTLKGRPLCRIFYSLGSEKYCAAGLADSCELEVAYAIGHPHPTSIHVDTLELALKATKR